jgi:hypothetical protein
MTLHCLDDKVFPYVFLPELPGLKGYSATQLREMRLFYEAWQILDPNSSVTTDESQNQTLIDTAPANSSVMTDELQTSNNQIDIYHAIQIPNLADFPVEDFFKVPFTHHTQIRAIKTSLDARYYYIHRTSEEHLTTRALEKLIKDDAYGHRESIPSNFKSTIPQAELARKAVMMFKDSYLLDFISGPIDGVPIYS